MSPSPPRQRDQDFPRKTHDRLGRNRRNGSIPPFRPPRAHQPPAHFVDVAMCTSIGRWPNYGQFRASYRTAIRRSFILITSLFFSGQSESTVNDILIPRFKNAFALSDFQSSFNCAMKKAFGCRHRHERKYFPAAPASPPNAAMFSRTQASTATMSSMPRLAELENASPPALEGSDSHTHSDDGYESPQPRRDFVRVFSVIGKKVVPAATGKPAPCM